jgi:hypothetical protein
MSVANLDTSGSEYQVIKYQIQKLLNIGTNVAGSKHCIRYLLLDAAEERTMNQSKQRLNKDLHLRLDETFQNLLVKIATENNLKPSTFARIVLQRTVPSYSRNRFYDVL